MPNSATTAFSATDVGIACRWAALVRPAGHRVCSYAGGPLLVFLPGQARPAFTLHTAAGTVVLTDVMGMTMRFPDLAAALLAVSPCFPAGRRSLAASPLRRRAAALWQPVAALLGQTRHSPSANDRSSAASTGTNRPAGWSLNHTGSGDAA